MKGWIAAGVIAAVMLVAGPPPVQVIALVAIIEGAGLALLDWGWK